MRRKETIGLLLACLTSVGVISWTAADCRAQPAKRALTVASFNINWGNPNLAEIAKLISQSGADLVALQETNETSQRYLRRELARHYAHIKFRNPAGRYLGGGFGFLSKIPLEDLRYVEAKHGLFARGSVRCVHRASVARGLQPAADPTHPGGRSRQIGLSNRALDSRRYTVRRR